MHAFRATYPSPLGLVSPWYARCRTWTGCGMRVCVCSIHNLEQRREENGIEERKAIGLNPRDDSLTRRGWRWGGWGRKKRGLRCIALCGWQVSSTKAQTHTHQALGWWACQQPDNTTSRGVTTLDQEVRQPGYCDDSVVLWRFAQSLSVRLTRVEGSMGLLDDVCFSSPTSTCLIWQC